MATPDNPALTISIVSLIVSCAALVVAALRSISAWHANRIAGSNPWATEVMKHVTAEILETAQDSFLVGQLCFTPFDTLDRKKEVRSALKKLRAEAGRRLHVLSILCPKAGTLRKLRRAMETIDDSYFDNQEQSLPKVHADSFQTLYRGCHEKYMSALRDVAAKISSRKFDPSDKA